MSFSEEDLEPKVQYSGFLSQKMDIIIPICLFRFMMEGGDWSLNLYISAAFRM